jgi:hypothetical protein
LEIQRSWIALPANFPNGTFHLPKLKNKEQEGGENKTLQ